MGDEKSLREEQGVIEMLERASSVIKSQKEQLYVQGIRLQMFDDMKALFNASNGREFVGSVADGSRDLLSMIDNYVGVVKKLSGNGNDSMSGSAVASGPMTMTNRQPPLIP